MTKIIYLEDASDELHSSLSLFDSALFSGMALGPERSIVRSLGEIHSRRLKVIDDGNPTQDDFHVVKPIVNFTRSEKNQILLIYTQELAKLTMAEIVGFDFSTAPSMHLPAIYRDKGDTMRWQQIRHTDRIAGRTDALLFHFGFPQTGPHLRYDFHFEVSVQKRDRSMTSFLVDPQVGNDPPGP